MNQTGGTARGNEGTGNEQRAIRFKVAKRALGAIKSGKLALSKVSIEDH